MKFRFEGIDRQKTSHSQQIKVLINAITKIEQESYTGPNKRLKIKRKLEPRRYLEGSSMKGNNTYLNHTIIPILSN